MTDELFGIIRSGDREAGVNALARGANPNARDPLTGLTCVMLASGYGRPRILRDLLAAGGDVHASDSRAGATALHKACQGGSLECAEILVEAGAFLDAQCVSTGHTALVEAIWFKQPQIVSYLLDRNAGLAIQTHYGFNLDEHIAYAMRVNQSEPAELKKVIQARDLVTARRERDQSMQASQPLMAATLTGDVATVRTLLDGGAKVDERYPVVNGFHDAHTPLLVASRDGHTAIVIALLAGGADVNAVEPTFHAAPLHKAVYNGHSDITRLLIAAAGVHLDVQGATNGYTPLLDAIWHGFGDCSLSLIEAGADTSIVGHDGKSPLDLAEVIFGLDHDVTQALRRRSSPAA